MSNVDKTSEAETQTEAEQVPPVEDESSRWVQVLLVCLFLYLFLCSIGMLGAGFKLFGKGFAKTLIATTANPFVGLFIGVLATSLIQSSSTTTSMVVAFVASGSLTIEGAVPIIMGANIGTTVTNTLVSLGHMTRASEFRRALSAATVHDFFNLMAVAILLPLEIATGILRHGATWLTGVIFGTSAVSFASPVKIVTSPVVGLVKSGVAGLPKGLAGSLVAVLGLVLLFISLYFITKTLRGLLMQKIEGFFNKTIGNNAILAMLMGLVITAAVQSSSITTSLLIPMAAAGAVSLAQVFPITLGANVGTTVTALLAALAGNVAGVTIALCHLLFNLAGILLIYPVPFIRNIPMRLANGLGNLAAKSKVYAFGFVLGLFFVLPGILVFVYRMIG